jgi:tannase/feruloyl esterase
LAQDFSENFWRYLVYGNPQIDVARLDLFQAFTDARSRTGMLLNALDPDLSAIRAAGKKIIQYHGWADALIPAQYSTTYYEAVENYLARDNRDFYRLFMVPGMNHCGEGPGPNVFGNAYVFGGSPDAEHNALTSLMQWVEVGRIPERIVATKYQDDDPDKPILRTRPLCVYPSVARWRGKGSTDDAQNFVCLAQPSAGARRD